MSSSKLRYDYWEDNNYQLVKNLKSTSLFQDRLLPDMIKGDVFAAARRKKIDFYYEGGKMFSFHGKHFQSNLEYLAAFENRPAGEVRENSFTQLRTCKSFKDAYYKIKKNIKSYSHNESGQVSKLSKNHSCWREGTGPIVVFDIELSLKKIDDPKRQDRIDLTLFNQESKELRLIEVKTFINPEIHAKKGKIEVIGQIERYQKQLEQKHEQIVENYKQYDRIMSKLCGTNKLNPKSIYLEGVDLVVFDFDNALKKVLINQIIPSFENKFKTFYMGQAKNVKQDTLKKWWSPE